MDTKIKIDNILSNNKIIDLENFLEIYQTVTKI